MHAELCTETKIFCGCKNAFGAEVNTLCCPVCMGMPGTLPVLNKQVVDYAIKMGHALNCSINRVSKNDRKNYFLSGPSKAYQISQFDVPLCENGYLDILVEWRRNGASVSRASTSKRMRASSFTMIPLTERWRITTAAACRSLRWFPEPDLRSAEEAKAYIAGHYKHPALSRHLRRQDAGGQCARRRERLCASPRTEGIRHSNRDEKRQQLRRGVPRHPVRRSGRSRSSARVALSEQETRRWDDAKGSKKLCDALERGCAGLPLFPQTRSAHV